MGAVAMIALLAGGPLGMCLALAYGAVSVMKIAKVDSQYAAKGEMPPSTRLIEKWLDSRTAKGAKPQKVRPYGSWAYTKQRWQAMWETLGDKHRATYTAEKKARDEAIAAGRPLPKKMSARQRAELGWRWVIDSIVNPVAEKRAPKAAASADTMTLAEALGAEVPSAGNPTDGPRTACEDCGQTLTEKDGGWVHPSSAGCPRKPAQAAASGPALEPSTLPETPARPTGVPAPLWEHATRMRPPCPQCGTPTTVGPSSNPHYAVFHCPACNKATESWGWQAVEDQAKRTRATSPASAPPGPPQPGTNQPRPNPGPGNTSATEGVSMTTTAQPSTMSGEVTGTRSAVVYCTAMADAHANHGGNEGFLTSLANMEVGEGDISKVRAAMEASTNAGAMWAAAAESIHANNAAIREAYATAPDAANKTANINE